MPSAHVAVFDREADPGTETAVTAYALQLLNRVVHEFAAR